MSFSVGILLLNGGFASTAIQPMEVFIAAGRLWKALNGEPGERLFDVKSASENGSPVRIDHRLTVTPECAFADLGRPDLIFVPAAGLEFEAMLSDGYDIDEVVRRNANVVTHLRQWADAGIAIAGVCSGVALLASSGLLDGKPATAHWGLADRYREKFPQVDWREEYLVTDAGDIYCGGGANAAADLSLYLVEKFCGRQVALETARAMIIEMPRTWQNSFTHFSLRANHNDEPILKAQAWMQHNYSSDVRFDMMASEVGMSGRNFARRFREATGETPLNYLQSMRIAIAKQLLETSRSTVQQIAENVGYVDLIFFRNLFKRHTGLSPTEYRTRFGFDLTKSALG